MSAPAEPGPPPAPLLPVEDTFEGFLDLEWVALSDSAAHVRLAVRDNLKQPLGLLHGGIYSAVAETVASVATFRAVWSDGYTASGLSNVASFLRPVTGGTLDVHASRRAHDDHEWLWTNEFTDEAGRLCALVQVTIAVRPNRPPGG